MFYASNVNNNNSNDNNNKMEIQIYKRVYASSNLKGFCRGASNIWDIFKCSQCYFSIINFCRVIQSCKSLDRN